MGALLLTDELRQRLERELAAGVPVAVAAQRARVGRRTLHRWLADGRLARPEPPPPEPVFDEEVELSLTERLGQAEPALVGAMISAARRGDWRASAWVLERIAPDGWGPPGERAQPWSTPVRDDDPFLEVDQLAERRRRRDRTDE
jgi:hypothetical protein